MQAVGIGDLHLSSHLGKGGLSAYVDDHDASVIDAVKRGPLKFARANGIKHIFLYGDICCEPRMSYEAQLQLIELFQLPFMFHVILGNHDLVGETPEGGHSLDIIKKMGLRNVSIYEKPTLVEIDGAQVQFLPFPYSKFRSDALNVAHVDVAGAKTDSGRPVKKGDEGKAYAVLGHIHTNQRIRNSFYSGTLYQTNFGESAEKFFHHISYDSGWVIESIPSKPRYRLHTVEVTSRKDLKSLPSSDSDLIKLILKDNAKISAADYGDLRVVKTVTVNGDHELALARVADLNDGAQVEVSTDEFFNEWFELKNVDPELKQRTIEYRRSKLQGA